VLTRVHSASLIGFDAHPAEVAVAGGHNVLALCPKLMLDLKMKNRSELISLCLSTNVAGDFEACEEL
jgi:hypothetical protein